MRSKNNIYDMNRILYIFTFTLLALLLSCCSKFEIITHKGNLVTVNKGYNPNWNPSETVFGKKTVTDSTTGDIISITKYRCIEKSFGREKCISRTRIYEDGKWTIGWTRQKIWYELY